MFVKKKQIEKKVLDHGLVLKKFPKPCIDINTGLQKKAKSDSKKGFFMLVNNSVFNKTMENVRKHSEIKLVTTEKKKKLFRRRTKFIYYLSVYCKNR